MLIDLPAIESLNAFSLEDVVGCGEEIGLVFGVMQTSDLFRLELNDCLDHIDWLDDAGGEHARNTADPEGLDEIDDFRGGGFLGSGWV